MNSLTIFNKIELLLKTEIKDPRIQSTETKIYIDSQLVISGDYLIVNTDKANEDNTITTTANVYPLKNIIGYRTNI